jgi:LmbE family N-acetylglucosaminyl deacetylase
MRTGGARRRLAGAALAAALALARGATAVGPVTDAGSPTAGRPPTTPLAIPAKARVLVFSPHPDDETVAVGGLIYRLVHRGTPVRVVFMTNGDGFPLALEEGLDVARPVDSDYLALGQLRQREARAATRQLGLARRDVHFLGFPDGGLAELWRAHWRRNRPYTSPYTKEDSPPYSDAVNPEVDYDGQDLTSVISRELSDFRPTLVIMPHPFDRHPDHLHTSYFVTEAVSALADKGLIARPTLITYLVHFPSWPATQPPPSERVLTISELPDTHWLDSELGPAELAAKRAALAQYKSQLEVMNGFLRRFLCRNELFERVDPGLLARIASVH